MVFQFLKDTRYYKYCEKAQCSHRWVAEAFALSFDGSKVLIRKEEFMVDETLTAEVTKLLRTWEKLFKTTITKDVEFISYLKPEHKWVVWKKRA